jgi:hypothetical protein
MNTAFVLVADVVERRLELERVVFGDASIFDGTSNRLRKLTFHGSPGVCAIAMWTEAADTLVTVHP